MARIELDAVQLDAIREISSIAVGNASVSLSRLLGKKVIVGQPAIALESIRGASEILGDPETIVSAVYSSVAGEIPGGMLLVLPAPEAAWLAGMLADHAGVAGEEMTVAAIKELANILIGTYLRVYSRELGVTLTHSVPSFTSDMGGAILDGPLARQSLDAGYVVVMDGSLAVNGVSHGMHLLFILEPTGLQVMLEALHLWKEREQ